MVLEVVVDVGAGAKGAMGVRRREVVVDVILREQKVLERGNVRSEERMECMGRVYSCNQGKDWM